MPPKKEKITLVKLVNGKRKRIVRAKPNAKSKPKEKSKQKQKQRQVVNVNISSGGGGGSGFIPYPTSEPARNYSLLSNLLRPANTVSVPIRDMPAVAETIATRPAEAPALNVPASRQKKAGESEEAFNLRIVKYEQQLANKAKKAREQTETRQREKVLAKIPQAEAFGSSATFVGPDDIFAEKYGKM